MSPRAPRQTPEPEPVEEVPEAPQVDAVEAPAVDEVPDAPSPAPEIDPPADPDGEGVPDEEEFSVWDVVQPRDHTLTWPHEESVHYRVPHAATGKIATQLLEAADELGYPPAAIRSQSDGFLVPSLVYYHLFPSQTPTPADAEDRDE